MSEMKFEPIDLTNWEPMDVALQLIVPDGRSCTFDVRDVGGKFVVAVFIENFDSVDAAKKWLSENMLRGVQGIHAGTQWGKA